LAKNGFDFPKFDFPKKDIPNPLLGVQQLLPKQGVAVEFSECRPMSRAGSRFR
jgi:hypothetical protein